MNEQIEKNLTRPSLPEDEVPGKGPGRVPAQGEKGVCYS